MTESIFFHNPNCQIIFIIHCCFKGFSQKCFNVIAVSINNSNYPNSGIFDQFHMMGIWFLTLGLHLTWIWNFGSLNHVQGFRCHWQSPPYPWGVNFNIHPQGKHSMAAPSPAWAQRLILLPVLLSNLWCFFNTY